jgi:murein DD-endopeptidase MepM/ murein hydrolase activator NlpD
MSRPAELTLAAAAAATGLAAMVWWPADQDTPAPPSEDTMPHEDVNPEETPPPVDPEPAQPPEEAPLPEDPDPEVEPTDPGPMPELPPGPADDAGDAFSFMPPGQLVEDSGTGQALQMNYAPGIRFPMEAGQAYANSQVYGHGGYLGPGGGQCNASNYSYAWYDNFCETRGYSTPMCPAGRGHQGQDIRPATCQDDMHWAVAVADGTITSVGTYSVRLMTDDGIRYTYLHLDRDTLLVEAGDTVSRGERIGYVSNEFGGTATTIHLHFEIKMAVDTGAGIQNTPVPPYLALVDSYERLLTGAEAG